MYVSRFGALLCLDSSHYIAVHVEYLDKVTGTIHYIHSIANDLD